MKQQTSKNKPMYIKEFAALTGVHPDTIRRWQAQGKLPIKRNNFNSWRVFTQADVEAVRKLQMGKAGHL